MTQPSRTFRIGELAASVGVNIETIRYYERLGLVPEPPRTDAGYRQYSETDRWRLAFIHRGKQLGFSLREIGELLGGGAPRSASEVQRVASARLARVEGEIRDLTDRGDQLRRLIETCATGADDCLELTPTPAGCGDC